MVKILKEKERAGLKKKFFKYKVPVKLQNGVLEETVVASSPNDAKKRIKTVFKAKGFGKITKVSKKVQPKPRTTGVL